MLPPTLGIIKPNPAFAILNYFPGCLLCPLLKYLQYHDGIIIDSIHNAPRLVLIIDTEFVASRTNELPQIKCYRVSE